jgi:hypothetical protein
MSGITFEQLVAPVTELRALAPQALASWTWLLPDSSEPVLLTALGDLFVTNTEGDISFLDTATGTVDLVAHTLDEWKHLLQRSERIDYWFQPTFVAALFESGYTLAPEEVFSPTHPPVLGGKQVVENYSPSHWLAHYHVMGQIHRQVKDLPPGTKITKFQVEPW